MKHTYLSRLAIILLASTLPLGLMAEDSLSTQSSDQIFNDLAKGGNRVYDYVFAGAGASACVAAAELVKAGYKVLVVEAGHDTDPATTEAAVVDDIPTIEFVAGSSDLWERQHVVEGSKGCQQTESVETLLDIMSTKQVWRPYSLPQGTGGGGSIRHHYCVDVRGNPIYYDKIGELIGEASFWNAANANRIMIEQENNSSYRNPYHGKSGWLKTKTSTLTPFGRALLKAASEKGEPVVSDFANPRTREGIGPMSIQASPDGLRSDAYKDLLLPLYKKGKVDIMFNTLVDKVILEGDIATGLKVYPKANLFKFAAGGSKAKVVNGVCQMVGPDRSLPGAKNVYAKRIVVSGGALLTPTILQRSGIGNKSDLDAIGVKQKINSKGVGYGYTDHLEVWMNYKIDPTKYIPPLLAHIMLGAINVYPPAIQASIMRSVNAFPNALSENTSSIQIEVEERGIPTVHTTMFEVGKWGFDPTFSAAVPPIGIKDPVDPHGWPHPQSLQVPDPTQPFKTPGIPKNFFAEILGGESSYVVFVIGNLLQEVSNGTVKARSSDPRDEPIVDMKLYQDTAGIERLAKEVLRIRSWMSDPKIVSKFGSEEFLPGQLVANKNDLMKWIALQSLHNGQHMSGTVHMGPDKDANSPLDAKMRVKGTKNLFVCDMSVFPPPWNHPGNTSRGAYVAGQIFADMQIAHFAASGAKTPKRLAMKGVTRQSKVSSEKIRKALQKFYSQYLPKTQVANVPHQ